MGWIAKLAGSVTGNPMFLIWLTAAVLALSAAIGGRVAWEVQGWRLDALQARYDGFVAQTKTIGEQAEIKAEETNDLHQKTLEDVSHAWEKELPIARNNAVAAYLAAHPVRVSRSDTSCNQVPGNAGSQQSNDGTGKECVPDETLIRDCAEDALKIGTWQDWARLNLLPVK